MANSPWSALVTLLLPRSEEHRFALMLSELTRHLLAQGTAVEEVGLEGPALATLRMGAVRLTAAWCRGALGRGDYADYRRPARHCDPANDEGAVDRLAAHACRLVVSCALEGADHAVAEAAFRAVLSHLVTVEPEVIVLWPRDRTLFTADEFRRLLGRSEVALGRSAPPRATAAGGGTDAADDAAEADAAADRPAPLLLLPPPRVAVRRIARMRPAAPPAMEAANDHPDIPALPAAELQRVRAALYPDAAAAGPAGVRAMAVGEGGDATLAMRLSAAAMNMTLLVVALPVGAAVVTHNLLRGRTDMRVSARMMALTGALMALVQSDVGSALTAML